MYSAFMWLAKIYFNRNFNSLSIQGEFNDNGHAVLVIANHISWWDGAWIMLLNHNVMKRKFSFMMLEEKLKQHWYLNYIGGFSIHKKSRSIIESINYAGSLLKESGNMVLMFPQGEIHSLYNEMFQFEQGIDRMLQKISPETQILFVANLLDYFSDIKPNLVMSIKTFLVKDFKDSKTEKEYNRFYSQVLQTQKNKIV